MKNYKKIFLILMVILLIEVVGYFLYRNYKTSRIDQTYSHKEDTLDFEEEKERKKLNDEFELNKYLATGKNAYERIYNSKQNDITDLIQKLALEAFPDSWNLEVKVEEFTKYF